MLTADRRFATASHTIEKVYVKNVEPLYAELEHFVNCVRCGSEPSVGGEQALKALRLATLIEQMALDGKVWKLSDRDRLEVLTGI